MKKYISQISLLLAGVLIATGLSIANAAGVWTPPCGTPPTCNVDAPLNVGSSPQIKSGPLTIGGVVVNGRLQILGGDPAAGKILQSDATGLASWVDPGELKDIECVGEGLIHVTNDGALSDSGNSRFDDDMEVYCRKGIARFCLSGENCPWRTDIDSADNLVCASNMNWDSNAVTNPQDSSQKQLAEVDGDWGWRGYTRFYCSTDGTTKDAVYLPRKGQSGQGGIRVR